MTDGTKHDNIYEALAAAMGDVKRLAKGERNNEQKYSFASVDDFLAMAGPVCAMHGLVTLMDEESVEAFERAGKYGPSFWLRIRFQITTFHTTGASLPTVKRTVEVIRTGAQSFGSAQSYALKQYLRALLMIPTGDADSADLEGAGNGAPTKTEQIDHGGAIKDAWVQGVLDGIPDAATAEEKAAAFADAIIDDFKGRAGLKALENAWKRHERRIEKMREYPALFHKVCEAHDVRQNELSPSESEAIPG